MTPVFVNGLEQGPTVFTYPVFSNALKTAKIADGDDTFNIHSRIYKGVDNCLNKTLFKSPPITLNKFYK